MKLKDRVLESKFVQEVLLAPLEPILHDSTFRLKFMAWALIGGEPLYLLVWGYLLPQPAESIFLRVTSFVLAIPLTLNWVHREVPKAYLERYWVFLCFYTLPFAFITLYRLNGYNHVWMESCVAMIYLLFFLTDWRIVIGLLPLSVLLVIPLEALGAISPAEAASARAWPELQDIAIFVFAVITGAGLAMSASNLRRERMRAALITVGVMAHEFRTPLASAGLISQALVKNENPEMLQRGLTRLGSVLDTMNAMIDFQMANASMMNMPRMRKTVDMGMLVQLAALDYPVPAHELHQITISCDSDLLAKVHPEIMRQVVHNLLSNARKSIKRAGKATRASQIEVKVSEHPLGAVLVEVTDWGIGISSERMDLLFEPFQTTSNMPSHGLGLTMCRNAVTSFGGKIWCTSKLGAGATFHVELPRANAATQTSTFGQSRGVPLH